MFILKSLTNTSDKCACDLRAFDSQENAWKILKEQFDATRNHLGIEENQEDLETFAVIYANENAAEVNCGEDHYSWEICSFPDYVLR